MLQVVSNTIQESTTGGYVPTPFTGLEQYQYCYPNYQTIYWGSYPVYICTDKTKKAIEILKSLQSEKLLEVKSVNKFIELVEKISNLL